MNYILFTILFFFVIFNLFEYFLEFLNCRHLKKHSGEIPPEFDGHIDASLLEKTKNYTIEKTKFGIASSLFDEFLVLVFIFSGLLQLYNDTVSSWELTFVLSGLVFMLIINYARTFIEIPFNLYSKFKIEKKYGFNTMTPALWVTDFIKELFLSGILLSVMLGACFGIIQALPDFWWLPLWGFFFIFTIFMMYLSPYVIEPLFNKFTPLDNPELEEGIKKTLEKAGLKVSRVFRMDASKRTKHTNAYFSGIGHVKRIVLFDTLLEQLTPEEIIAVLAHEAGHWKKKHILKYIFIFEITAFAGFFISFVVLKHNISGKVFLIENASFFTQLVLLSFSASALTWPFSPLLNILSRRFERQADDFAVKISGRPEALASALVKLSKDNLSNLHPHPLYSAVHYSHPPAAERIKYLKEKENGESEDEKI